MTRAKLLKAALQGASTIAGLAHAYWWLLVPPILLGALVIAGFHGVPDEFARRWHSLGYRMPMSWASAIQTAVKHGAINMVCFAVGWLIRSIFQ